MLQASQLGQTDDARPSAQRWPPSWRRRRCLASQPPVCPRQTGHINFSLCHSQWVRITFWGVILSVCFNHPSCSCSSQHEKQSPFARETSGLWLEPTSSWLVLFLSRRASFWTFCPLNVTNCHVLRSSFSPSRLSQSSRVELKSCIALLSQCLSHPVFLLRLAYEKNRIFDACF